MKQKIWKLLGEPHNRQVESKTSEEVESKARLLIWVCIWEQVREQTYRNLMGE